jgi:hypothetical protein
MSDLRIQIRKRPDGRGEHWDYRVARANGWNCGCWHPTVAKAVDCVERRSMPSVAVA